MTNLDHDSDLETSNKQPLDGGPLADAGERKTIFHVLDSFRQYRRQTHFGTTHRRRQNFYALSKRNQDLLNGGSIALLDTLSHIDDAIDDNSDIADAILQQGLETFGLPETPEEGSMLFWHETARALDLNKAHSTIKQFWRDWSQEGYESEVEPIVQLVLKDMDCHVLKSRGKSKVLVPGAGLGRLLYELCLAGFDTEGNEISYHQLLASNFVLNTTSRAHQYKLYPFVNDFNNHVKRSDQLRLVTIPDVHPGQAMEEKVKAGQAVGQMSMTAGDFISSYSSMESAGAFDAVVTHYFIDTAPNVIRYLETIHHCLSVDGIWINIGPLLWHFEDSFEHNNELHTEDNDHEEAGQKPSRVKDGIAEPGSVELTNEEVVDLVQRMGFEMLACSNLAAEHGGYIQDPGSMLQHIYHCSHWVARRKAMDG